MASTFGALRHPLRLFEDNLGPLVGTAYARAGFASSLVLVAWAIVETARNPLELWSSRDYAGLAAEIAGGALIACIIVFLGTVVLSFGIRWFCNLPVLMPAIAGRKTALVVFATWIGAGQWFIWTTPMLQGFSYSVLSFLVLSGISVFLATWSCMVLAFILPWGGAEPPQFVRYRGVDWKVSDEDDEDPYCPRCYTDGRRRLKMAVDHANKTYRCVLCEHEASWR